jgi:hypothetical protein
MLAEAVGGIDARDGEIARVAVRQFLHLDAADAADDEEDLLAVHEDAEIAFVTHRHFRLD